MIMEKEKSAFIMSQFELDFILDTFFKNGQNPHQIIIDNLAKTNPNLDKRVFALRVAAISAGKSLCFEHNDFYKVSVDRETVYICRYVFDRAVELLDVVYYKTTFDYNYKPERKDYVLRNLAEPTNEQTASAEEFTKLSIPQKDNQFIFFNVDEALNCAAKLYEELHKEEEE